VCVPTIVTGNSREFLPLQLIALATETDTSWGISLTMNDVVLNINVDEC